LQICNAICKIIPKIVGYGWAMDGIRMGSGIHNLSLSKSHQGSAFDRRVNKEMPERNAGEMLVK
jgi:hypothetical protein